MNEHTGPKSSARYVRVEGVVRREVGGETVLVPVGEGGAAQLEYLYRLNAVGGVIWKALKTPVTLEELFEKVSEVFDLSTVEEEDTHAQVVSEIKEFLEELKSAGLVAGAPGDATGASGS
ncbi:MAG TPA: PqqD family peptide modification chaperone [Candidatus Sumerlaeota bacterium]|nr:PqqD family peptide modification chaperone [Candidatus Sumerlaeota bacterium]HPS00231.1 PqqD family peptide modification chaperone [Candidatus Sumerlaeota bacterium]